jgi:hypothetical protein
VKINSLFRDKAYAFSQAGDPEDDCKFAATLLKKIKSDIAIKNIFLWSVGDDYDVFLLVDKDKRTFKLKTSLSDPEGVLKRESVALRRNPCSSLPVFVDYGTIKIGDEVTYLLTWVPQGESLRSSGRSALMSNLDLFLENYWELVESHNVKPTYKRTIDKFIKKLSPDNILPKESRQALESYTDYNLCKEFLADLGRDILNRFKKIQKKLNKKCHANLSLDSIFYYGDGFYFEGLENICMGHPYIDFCDLLIEVGSPEQNDIILWKKFCESGSIPHDRELYGEIYQMCIRKKLSHLLVSYIKEVYLYDSFRYEEIFYIADSFSHAYARFRQIESFDKNKDFIMKTICEPIFGVKA